MTKRSLTYDKSARTNFCVRLCTVVRKIRLIKILHILSFIENQELNYDTKVNRSVIRERSANTNIFLKRNLAKHKFRTNKINNLAYIARFTRALRYIFCLKFEVTFTFCKNLFMNS
jgi:hypothetical protein